MDSVYRLKHKPTGLFFKTVSGRFKGQKSNLSKNGKIYLSKPSAKKIGYSRLINVSDKQVDDLGLQCFLKYDSSSIHRQNLMNVLDEDWEAVEYKVISKALYDSLEADQHPF